MGLTQVKAQIMLEDIKISLSDKELLKALCNRLEISPVYLTQNYLVEDGEDGVLYHLEDVGGHQTEWKWVKCNCTQEVIKRVQLVKGLATVMGCSELESWDIP